MELKIHIRLEEKITYLRKKGYDVKKQKETMAWSAYHNDVEYGDFEVWTVYKNGREYGRPMRRDFADDEWVNKVFDEEIEQRLKKFILEL